jgi:L-asparaginase II
LVDLTHRAHVAVVNSEGKLLYHIGDPNRVTFVRSSAKPIQALVACESGAVDAYGLSEEELALLCASHNGEELHVKSVKSILEKAGLDEGALQCGFHPSLDAKVAKTQPKELSPAYSNCSGKHSGMLITACHLGEDINDYLSLSHPHQKRIIATLSELSSVPYEEIITAIDGCGVPVHALPLKAFAQAYARMASLEGLSEERAACVGRITGAMRNHPFMVAGSNRACTRIMEVSDGKVFAKLGADGYYAVGVPDRKWGITCKVEDGSVPIVEGLIIHVLYALGIINEKAFEALEEFHSPVRFNHRGDKVGNVAYTLQWERKSE